MNADTEISLEIPMKAGKRDRLSMQDDDPKQAMEGLIIALFECFIMAGKGSGYQYKIYAGADLYCAATSLK